MLSNFVWQQLPSVKTSLEITSSARAHVAPKPIVPPRNRTQTTNFMLFIVITSFPARSSASNTSKSNGGEKVPKNFLTENHDRRGPASGKLKIDQWSWQGHKNSEN